MKLFKSQSTDENDEESHPVDKSKNSKQQELDETKFFVTPMF
jgi:hypothetical protein